MKFLLLSSLFIFSFSISAQSQSVDGKIAYQLKSGELVKRDVTIKVPSRGKGLVELSGKNFTWKTKDFWTVKKSGQTFFYASFKTNFMNKKSTIVFKGTYIKATNEIMYYGDFYKKKGHYIVTDDFTSLKDFTFTGAFKFQYII